MSKMSSLQCAIWIGGALVVFGTAACTLASPTYITATDAPADDAGATTSSSSSSSSSSSGSSGTPGLTCSTDDYLKVDLTTLTACGDGNKGHCYDKTKIQMADELAPCADASMVCVPDEILEANGQPLQSCTSIVGPGGCVAGTLIPELVAQGGDKALKHDVCAAGLLCVPCTDPGSGKATPFCSPIGAHKNACAASAADAGAADPDGGTASALPGCCTTNGKSNGVCLPDSAIPASEKGNVPQDSCNKGNSCAPAAFVSNKPVACKAGSLLGAGVCMDTCFSEYMSIASTLGVLDRDKCGQTEVCVPCQAVSGEGISVCP